MIPNDHITEKDLALFSGGRLSAARTVEIAGHIEVCRTCSELFALAPSSAWGGLPLDPETCLSDHHLEFDQIVEYLDGTLDAEEREVIDVHLRGCGACAEDLNSLRSFRLETEPAMGNRYFESRVLTKLANISFEAGVMRLALAAVGLVLMAAALVWFFNSQTRPEAPIVNRPPKVMPSPEPVRPIDKDDLLPVDEVKREYMVAINDGGRRVGLDSEGRLIGFTRLPEGLKGDVARVLRGRALRANPEIEELRTPDGVARSASGEAEPLSLLAPVATLVREVRPRFRWAAQEGVTGYTVTVVDDRFNPVAESAPLAALEWRPEADLERGRVYQWQVTAYKDDQPVESRLRQVGLFKVIGAGELDAILKAEAVTDSALVRAVLYAKAGLLEDAGVELNKLDRSGNSAGLRDKLRRAILTRKNK